jgi:hypothetical protein
MFFGYVIRRFNASSAGLKKPLWLDLRCDAALRDLQIQLELIKKNTHENNYRSTPTYGVRHLILISSDSNM